MVEEKTYKYRGKTLEELQNMSLEEFALLLPSSLRRKLKRGFTEEENIFLKNLRSGVKKLKTHCRDLLVLPEMVGKKISIYNGKEFVEILILEEMIGLRFGELTPTRKIAKHSGTATKKAVVKK